MNLSQLLLIYCYLYHLSITTSLFYWYITMICKKKINDIGPRYFPNPSQIFYEQGCSTYPSIHGVGARFIMGMRG